MDQQAIRRLIREKLADGRLPHDHIPRMYGGPGQGETCNACDLPVDNPGLIMEGIAVNNPKPLQLHVQCFWIWDDERRNADGTISNG